MNGTFRIQWEQVTPWEGTILFLLGIFLFFFTYEEFQNRFRFRWETLFLRIGLVIFLLLYFLNPAFLREKEEEEPGSFLLIVDRTPSVWLRKDMEEKEQKLLKKIKEIFQGKENLTIWAYLGGDQFLPVENERELPFGTGETHLLRSLSKKKSVLEKKITILVHDGIEVTSPTYPEGSGWGKPLPISVIAIPSASSTPPFLLERVQADAYGLVRSPLRMEFLIRRRESSVKGIRIEIWEGKKKIADEKTPFPSGNDTLTIPMEILPTQEGEVVYKIVAKDTEGRFSPSFHQLFRKVKILRDRIRILHIVGEPTWESRMFREIVKRESLIDLVTFQILRTREDRPMVFSDEELSLIPFPVQELFTTELPKFDIVVFQNFDYQPYVPIGLSHALLQNLRDFVEKNRGGFFLLLGELTGENEILYRHTPISTLLPVEPTGTWRKGKFPLFFPPSPLFSFLPQKSLSLSRYFQTYLKEGSTILATEKGDPILVAGTRGEGRTAILLTDRFWEAYYQPYPENKIAIKEWFLATLKYLAGDPQFEPYHIRWKKGEIAPGEEGEGEIVSEKPVTHTTVLLEGKEIPSVIKGSTLSFSSPFTEGVVEVLLDQKIVPEKLPVSLPFSEKSQFVIPLSKWREYSKKTFSHLIFWEEEEKLERLLTTLSRKVTVEGKKTLKEYPLFWGLWFLLLSAEIFFRRAGGGR
jgi:hypothetical protein